MTDPLTLDEAIGAVAEKVAYCDEWRCVEIGVRTQHLRALLAAARELHNLKSQLAHVASKTRVEQVNAVASLGPDHDSWTIRGIRAVARKLGWSPSNGGTDG